jgi:hypothetical protein
MNDTPVSILQKAGDLGLKLGLKPPETLTVDAAKPCPKDFADTLKAYKPQLLTLLRLPFVMLYSKALEETIFFCEVEDTKAVLASASAEPFSIYTKDELRILVAHNRTAPLTAEAVQAP